MDSSRLWVHVQEASLWIESQGVVDPADRFLDLLSFVWELFVRVRPKVGPVLIKN